MITTLRCLLEHDPKQKYHGNRYWLSSWFLLEELKLYHIIYYTVSKDGNGYWRILKLDFDGLDPEIENILLKLLTYLPGSSASVFLNENPACMPRPV